MKHILTHIFLFCSVLAFSQNRYAIIEIPTCWTTPAAVDSSVNRVVLVTTQTSTPTTLYYTDAQNNSVNVTGGSLAFGYCDCCGGGSGGSGVVTALNGLTNISIDSIKLGGQLFENTTIAGNNKNLDFTGLDTSMYIGDYLAFVGNDRLKINNVFFPRNDGFDGQRLAYDAAGDSLAWIAPPAVDTITTFADTTIIINPQSGDVAVLSDGSGAAFYNGSQWWVLDSNSLNGIFSNSNDGSTIANPMIINVENNFRILDTNTVSLNHLNFQRINNQLGSNRGGWTIGSTLNNYWNQAGFSSSNEGNSFFSIKSNTVTRTITASPQNNLSIELFSASLDYIESTGSKGGFSLSGNLYRDYVAGKVGLFNTSFGTSRAFLIANRSAGAIEFHTSVVNNYGPMNATTARIRIFGGSTANKIQFYNLYNFKDTAPPFSNSLQYWDLSGVPYWLDANTLTTNLYTADGTIQDSVRTVDMTQDTTSLIFDQQTGTLPAPGDNRDIITIKYDSGSDDDEAPTVLKFIGTDGDTSFWRSLGSRIKFISNKTMQDVAPRRIIETDSATYDQGPTGNFFIDGSISPQGIRYQSDYTTTLTANSLIPKSYVDDQKAFYYQGLSLDTIVGGGGSNQKLSLAGSAYINESGFTVSGDTSLVLPSAGLYRLKYFASVYDQAVSAEGTVTTVFSLVNSTPAFPLISTSTYGVNLSNSYQIQVSGIFRFSAGGQVKIGAGCSSNCVFARGQIEVEKISN